MASTTVKFGAEYSDVTTALSEMGHGLKEFGHELHSTERMANRFAGVISMLGGVGGEAGKALGSLAAGLAIGGPAGLAMGAIAALIEQFKELKKEAKETAKQVEESISKIADETQRLNDELAGRTKADTYRAQIDGIDSFMARIERTKEQAKELRAVVAEKAAKGILDFDSQAEAERLEAFAKSSEKQAEELGLLRKKAALLKEIQAFEGVEAKKKNEKGSKEQERKDAEDATKIDQAYYEAKTLRAQSQLDEVQKLKDEFAVKDEQLQDKIGETDNKTLKDNLEVQRQALKQFYDFKVNEAQLALDKEFQDTSRAATREAEEKVRKMQEGLRRAQAESDRFDSEVAAQAHELAQPYERAAHGMMNSFRTAFMDILRGGKSFGEIMQDIFMSLVNVVIGAFEDMAMKAIEKAIEAQFVDQATKAVEAQRAVGLTYANTMASVSAIPIIGPFMAPEVAAANMALAESGAGMASAAGGWDIGSATPPVAQLHPNEMVLPAHLAEGIRQMVANGGSGGGGQPINVHLNITAMDGKDVYRTLTDSQTGLVRVLGDLQRKGAI